MKQGFGMLIVNIRSAYYLEEQMAREYVGFYSVGLFRRVQMMAYLSSIALRRSVVGCHHLTCGGSFVRRATWSDPQSALCGK